jgi:hypothetical protein
MALRLAPSAPPPRSVRRRVVRRRHAAARPAASGGLLSRAWESATASAPQLTLPSDEKLVALVKSAGDAARGAEAAAADAAAALEAGGSEAFATAAAGLIPSAEDAAAASAAAAAALRAAATAAGLGADALEGDSGSLVAALAGGAALFALALARAASSPEPEAALFRSYNPDATLRYCAARPSLALARATEVGAHAARFAVALAVDRATGQEAANAPARARQARESLTALGPAFVKIGQARRPALTR